MTYRITFLILSILITFSHPVFSADADVHEIMLQLADSSFAVRKNAIDSLGRSRDPRMVPFLEKFAEGSLYIYEGKVVVEGGIEMNDDFEDVALLLDAFTMQPIIRDGKALQILVTDLESVDAARKERRLVRDALVVLKLFDPDPNLRLSAVTKAGKKGLDSNFPILEELLETEKNKRIQRAVRESIAIIQLHQGDPALHLNAVEKLGDLRSNRALDQIKDFRKSNTDPEADKIYKFAIDQIEGWQRTVQFVRNVFSGISLGSILILMALGLSITFGLMGVINMAHGEMMMVGAYATFVTQQLFVNHFPESAFNAYFLCAIPISFGAAAIVGYLIEVLVIRHLYGRPLETLLATWGVSLILIQIARRIFGDNIAVNSPTWLQRGVEVAQDITFPYNRCFIILFCALCIGMMYFIIGRTKLGLLLRATMQNRDMAASLGVSTRWIDGFTFALGGGLAGLAGCALTQISNVTPDMGQKYIVNCFLVVVTGGVGKLVGAIWAGLGLGVVTKFLEPIFQAVWANALTLICVVIFIQFKPDGLFPPKGRLADD
ncbi:MAG: urea ABC transporter permease subunit UrtB [Candidatus Poribacteria bacterium]|nr:urea ABC transporter permease subunit UrtB [Candidatus Poribacteria bacterium]